MFPNVGVPLLSVVEVADDEAGKSCGFEANMTVCLNEAPAAKLLRGVVVDCCFNLESLPLPVLSPSLITRSGGRNEPGRVGSRS